MSLFLTVAADGIEDWAELLIREMKTELSLLAFETTMLVFQMTD